MNDIPKPEKLIPQHLEFLTNLRDSGVVNMFGASPYLQREFPGLTSREAMDIVAYWMRTL